VVRLVQKRELHVGEVDQLDVEPAVLGRRRGGPAADRQGDPPGPGAADEDL
jgi:hypothetical protein